MVATPSDRTGRTLTFARDGRDQRKLVRNSKMEWLPLNMLKVDPRVQRAYDDERAKRMAASLDLDALGHLTISYRDGVHWIMDGQTRAGALRHAGFGNDKVYCEVFTGLTRADEADLFLLKADTKAVTPFDKFRLGLEAQRPDEVAIDRIVRKAGLKVSLGGGWDSIGAVTSLRKVYERGGSILERTLAILKMAFEGDDEAFQMDLIRGMGEVLHRYGNDLTDEVMIQKLKAVRGGASIIRRRAETLKQATDRNVVDCVGGAIVDAYNEKLRTKRLNKERWWR